MTSPQPWAWTPELADALRRRREALNAAAREAYLRRMFDAQGGVCPWCSLPLPDDLADVAVDHIIPKCRGGPNHRWNKQLLHRVCNGAGGKGKSLTEHAKALAAEHGVTLREPPPPPRQFHGSRWTGWWSPDLRRTP